MLGFSSLHFEISRSRCQKEGAKCIFDKMRSTAVEKKRAQKALQNLEPKLDDVSAVIRVLLRNETKLI